MQAFTNFKINEKTFSGWKRPSSTGIYGKNSYDKALSDALGCLVDHINFYTGSNLTAAEQKEIEQAVKIKELRRHQYLLQEGDVCKSFSFVVKGALRMFSINERGQEAILSFGVEDCWLCDKESLSMQLPSRYNIEALERTQVLQMHVSQLDRLQHSIPAIAELIRIQERVQVIITQKRIHAAISMNAEERYYDMLESNPEYAQRFSQNMLASYLGIKPETLSRIRSR